VAAKETAHLDQVAVDWVSSPEVASQVVVETAKDGTEEVMAREA
jgi:hypothetical protein